MIELTPQSTTHRRVLSLNGLLEAVSEHPKEAVYSIKRALFAMIIFQARERERERMRERKRERENERERESVCVCVCTSVCLIAISILIHDGEMCIDVSEKIARLSSSQMSFSGT